MAKTTLVWADEVPEIGDNLDRRDATIETFFSACALVLGAPSIPFNTPNTKVDYNEEATNTAKFHAFFREFFPGKQPGAFTYVSYLIWYEKEQLMLNSAKPTVQKIDRG